MPPSLSLSEPFGGLHINLQTGSHIVYNEAVKPSDSAVLTLNFSTSIYPDAHFAIFSGNDTLYNSGNFAIQVNDNAEPVAWPQVKESPGLAQVQVKVNSGLSAGAKAGIAVGAIIGVLLVIGLIAVVYKRRRNRHSAIVGVRDGVIEMEGDYKAANELGVFPEKSERVGEMEGNIVAEMEGGVVIVEADAGEDVKSELCGDAATWHGLALREKQEPVEMAGVEVIREQADEKDNDGEGGQGAGEGESSRPGEKRTE